MMPGETPLWRAHDISQVLQDKLEVLPGVERAFVHVDHETSHTPVRYWSMSISKTYMIRDVISFFAFVLVGTPQKSLKMTSFILPYTFDDLLKMAWQQSFYSICNWSYRLVRLYLRRTGGCLTGSDTTAYIVGRA